MKGRLNKPIFVIMTSLVLVLGTFALVLPYQEAFATLIEDCTGDSSVAGERLILTADIMDVNETCIVIIHDNVTLDCKGHTIDGTDGNTAGISVTGNGVTVKNCNVTDHKSAIVLNGSDGSKITKNTLTSNQVGIQIGNNSMNNKVTANTATGNTARGLVVGDSSFNKIDRNDFSDNEVAGVGQGILLVNADDNSFSANSINGNRVDNVIVALGSDNNVFKRNTVNGSELANGFSIIANSKGNTFTGNTANGNALFGIDDDTVGGTGTGVTDNFYTRNSCSGNISGNSSPADLCS